MSTPSSWWARAGAGLGLVTVVGGSARNLATTAAGRVEESPPARSAAYVAASDMETSAFCPPALSVRCSVIRCGLKLMHVAGPL